MVCCCPAKTEQRNPTVKGIEGLKLVPNGRRKIVTVDLEKGKALHELLARYSKVAGLFRQERHSSDMVAPPSLSSFDEH